MKFKKTSFAVAAAVLCGASFATHAATPAPTTGTLEIWWKAPLKGSTVSGVLNDTKCYVNGRGVAKVEFSLGTTPLNTDTTMSDGMSCSLDTTKFANGTHTLTAVAYDSAGRTYRESASITIKNSTTTSTPTTSTPTNTPPAVSFSKPANGSTVSGVISCLANATDSDGVAKLQWYLGSTLLNTESLSPFDTCNLDTRKFADGVHTLRAVATDKKGAVGEGSVSLTIKNGTTTSTPTAPTAPTAPSTGTTALPAPTTGTLEVWFKSPAKGATVSGLLQGGSCYVAGRGVRRVEFFLDSTALNIDSVVSDGMSCVLDTTKFANGTHTLKAVAYDSSGKTYAEPITINVQNAVTSTPTAPAPAPTQPAPTTPPPTTTPTTPPPTSGVTPPAPALPSTNTKATPTFESIGLYWKPPSTPAGAKCDVRFRAAGETNWRQGYPMWFDARNGECRGSIVHLAPDNWYEVQFAMPGEQPVAQVNAKTWSENFPIAQVVHVTDSNTPLVITQGGTASGYVLYTPAPGSSATIDVQKAHDYNIKISAPYVIIRGLTLKNSRMDGIKIEQGASDLVIEDNDISEWSSWGGYTSKDGWKVARNKDSAIKAYCNAGPWLERTVIQRNKIHHPTYGANSWSGFSSGPSDPHPLGANGIYMLDCGGNHVWRYNDLYSETGRYFMDGFGGGENFSTKGFPNADTDIYGNRISHAWDDAIEAEGANRNVRIWGNYMDQTATGVATTSTSVGPVYVFRNVQNRSRNLSMSSLDADSRLYMFKSGSQSGYGGGRRFMFHNTALQAPPPAGSTYPLGAGEGLAAPSSTEGLTNTVSRNNIYHVWKSHWASIRTQGGSGNDLDYDLVNGSVTAYAGAEANRVVGVPIYAPGNGWISEGGGMYQLAPSSPGYDRGAVLPNFNDGFTGAAPDMGAHEAGLPAMRLGVNAGSAGGVWSGPLGSGTSLGSGSSTGGTSTGGTTTSSSGGVCSTALCVVNQ